MRSNTFKTRNSDSSFACSFACALALSAAFSACLRSASLVLMRLFLFRCWSPSFVAITAHSNSREEQKSWLIKGNLLKPQAQAHQESERTALAAEVSLN